MRRRHSRGDVRLLAMGVAACLLVVLLGIRQYVGSKPEFASVEEMSEVMEQTNSRLTFTRVIPGVSWIDGESPRASYTITNNHGFSEVYLFDKYAYTIETGGRDQAAREFCSLFQTLKSTQSRSPLIEAFRHVELTGSLDGKAFELGVKGKGDLIVEILYAIRSFLDLRSTRIDILVKGYADGTHGGWGRPFLPQYAYRRIDVLPPVNPNSLNPMVYRRASRPLEIPNPYKNNHLPDLRAEFVKRDLIEPVLGQCPGTSTTLVKILKGYEFTKPDSPNLRRVEVQVNIF